MWGSLWASRGAIMRIGVALVVISVASFGLGATAQDVPMVPPPPTLQLEGIPPVPQALADAIAPYASFRQAVFASWHPVERRMLVNTRLGDTFQAYSIAAPGAAPVQATFQESSVGSWTPGGGSAWFAEGGRTVVFRKDEGGNQQF